MRSARWWVVSIVLWASASAAWASPREAVSSLVQIRASSASGAVKLGTGVVIATDRVATACHVTRDAALIDVTKDDRSWRVTDQIGSTAHDLCVLALRGADLAPVRLRASSELEIGEPVTAIGFPAAEGGLRALTGTVLGLYAYDRGLVIRTDAPFEFGASGGGLFDASGNLVGVLAFKATSAEAARFALPSEWLDPAGSVAASFERVAPSTASAAFWELPQDTRPAFLGVALRAARVQRP